MRAVTITLCLLAAPALLFVAGCTSSATTPEAPLDDRLLLLVGVWR